MTCVTSDRVLSTPKVRCMLSRKGGSSFKKELENRASAMKKAFLPNKKKGRRDDDSEDWARKRSRKATPTRAPEFRRNGQLLMDRVFCLPGHKVLRVGQKGVAEFDADGEACATLVDLICSPQNRDVHGFFKLAGQAYPGYGTYLKIEAERHDSVLQEQFTSVLNREAIPRVYESVNAVRVLVDAACEQLGCDVKCAH